MAILNVEPNIINTDSNFVFATVSITGNINTGANLNVTDSIYVSNAAIKVSNNAFVFSTANSTVQLNNNVASFLSNVASGQAGGVGYTGSAGTGGLDPVAAALVFGGL